MNFLVSSNDNIIKAYNFIKKKTIILLFRLFIWNFEYFFMKREYRIIYSLITNYFIIIYNSLKKEYLFQMFNHLNYINEIRYNEKNNFLITKDNSFL